MKPSWRSAAVEVLRACAAGGSAPPETLKRAACACRDSAPGDAAEEERLELAAGIFLEMQRGRRRVAGQDRVWVALLSHAVTGSGAAAAHTAIGHRPVRDRP